MINNTGFELQPLTPGGSTERDHPPRSAGQFQSKMVSTTSEVADSDHARLNRTSLEKAGDTFFNNAKELLRFNISQPFINLYYHFNKPSDPTKAVTAEITEQHMQSLFESDYKKFTSYTSEGYMARTNENIFGQDQPLIATNVKSSFTDVIKSIILGHHNISPSDERESSPQQGNRATFDLKLARLFDLISNNSNVRVNPFAAARLDTPHAPTPDTIIARLNLLVQSGAVSKQEMLSKLQSECEQLTEFLLQNAGMSTYVKSLQIESPLTSGKSKAQVAARFINQSAAFLSNNVPPFYLSILGVILLERLSAGDLKADALNDMMKAPALNIDDSVRKEVVAFARNLYRAEKIDDVSQKPGNVVTTSMAFTLYITGSLQLLISQADENASNSELLEHCFKHFLAGHNDAAGNNLAQLEAEPARSGFNAAANSLIRGIGIASIGVRAIMNGAYEIKDATPDTALRDTIYGLLGKSFIPMSLMENAGYKDDLNKKNKLMMMQRCLVKEMLNQPLSGEEADFMKGIKGEAGSSYDFKSGVSKSITFATVILSMAALGADIGFALATPEASKEFWGSFAIEKFGVTYSHIYKGAVRPASALLNLAQVRWVSGSSGYSKHDVEAFVHIASRLFLATAPLIMWEEGLTLWDSIAAMIDTAITVGEDSAASRSLNKGQLAKFVELAVNNLTLEASAQDSTPIPNSTGRYVDELVQGVISRLLDEGAPEEVIAMDSRAEAPGLSKRPNSAP